MKLTQTVLKEYLKTEALIKRLEARKNEIRDAIKARKEPTFQMGDYLINKIKFHRVVPAHEQNGVRIQVKKVKGAL